MLKNNVYLHISFLIFLISPSIHLAIPPVDTFEELGFTDDAAVSLPRRIRHNSNLVWIADDVTLDILWKRVDPFFPIEDVHFLGRRPSA